jgi:hypothetical protein
MGTPRCTIDIDPMHQSITLTTLAEPPEPDVAKWRNIDFSIHASDEGDLAQLTVAVDDNLHAAYSLLTSVADLLQLNSEPLAAAIRTAIANHYGMFAGKAGLSHEKEVGLFGELLVLEYLIDQIGAGPAIRSWQGPLNEEHDFVFENAHLEVKTTASEQRRHMIHGFAQLVPLRSTPLSLISIQLTRSSREGGRTLPQIISQIRVKAGGFRPMLNDALEASGWDDEFSDLYSTCWSKRNQPRAYDVDERFPALTLSRLAGVVPSLKSVSELSYRVDVTHFVRRPLPGQLADMVEPPEEG